MNFKKKYLVFLFLHVILLSIGNTNAGITPDVANKVAENILNKVYESRHEALLNSLDTQETINAVDAMIQNKINAQTELVGKKVKTKNEQAVREAHLKDFKDLSRDAYLQQVRAQIEHQKKFDTIAVAFDENDNVLLAGNVRTRNIDVKDPKVFEAFAKGGNKMRNPPFTYDNFGLKNSDLPGIESGIRESENLVGKQFSAVTLVKPVQNKILEQTINENYQTALQKIENSGNNADQKLKSRESALSIAETKREALYHAEVALDKYLDQQKHIGERKVVLGTSKALCDDCKTHVEIDKRLDYDDRAGLPSANVKNWAPPASVTAEKLNLRSSSTTNFNNMRNRLPGSSSTATRPGASHVASTSTGGNGAATKHPGVQGSSTSSTSNRVPPPSSSSTSSRVPPRSRSSSTRSDTPPASRASVPNSRVRSASASISSSSTSSRLPPPSSSSGISSRVPPYGSSSTSSRQPPPSSSASTNSRVSSRSRSPSTSSRVPPTGTTGSSSSSTPVNSPSGGLPSQSSGGSSITPPISSASSTSSTSSGIPSRPVARPTSRPRTPTRPPPPRPTAKPSTRPVSTMVRPTSPPGSRYPTSRPHSPTTRQPSGPSGQPTRQTTQRPSRRPSSRPTTRTTTRPPSRSSN